MRIITRKDCRAFFNAETFVSAVIYPAFTKAADGTTINLPIYGIYSHLRDAPRFVYSDAQTLIEAEADLDGLLSILER